MDWQAAQGWGPDFALAMEPHAARGLEPARVILVYRKQLKVLCRRGELWARTGGRLMHHAASPDELPAVGDWVAARLPETDSGGEALVHAVLPRRSAFVRKVVGDRAEGHVLATNIDTVLVVMGLDADFNLRRLERFLTLAFQSRAVPLVVLNKSDVAVALDEQLAQVEAVAQGAEVRVVSALQGTGLEPLQGCFGPGKTVAVLGSSGVGKSTLVNRLLGSEVLATGGLRDDGKGRHTTTRRELLLLPGGGAVIDTPGVREVQLWEATEGLARSFDDVDALAARCRFGDCAHGEEPGCAVRAALADGTLEARRYESYGELKRELDRLESPAAERGRPHSKRRERVGHGARDRRR